MIERVLDRLLDDALRLGRRQAVLGLTLEFRLAHKYREHDSSADHHVFRNDIGGALALADTLGVILQAAQHRASHSGFVGAAVLGGHRVAVGGQETIGVRGPRNSPLARAMGANASGFPGEDIRMHQSIVMDRRREEIFQPAREVEAILSRNILKTLQQAGIAVPADLDPTEQIGLGASHLEQALRFEGGLDAEYLGVRLEANFRAAAVVDFAEIFELALGMSALERHSIELLAAGDLYFEPRRKRVHHRYANAVQAAGGLVNL